MMYVSEQYTDDVATYIVNIRFDLIYDECYSLHATTTLFCFCSGYC